MTGPLLPAQQAAVLSVLDADPTVIHELELEPTVLPVLVQNAPALAAGLLQRLVHTSQGDAFFKARAAEHTARNMPRAPVLCCDATGLTRPCPLGECTPC